MSAFDPKRTLVKTACASAPGWRGSCLCGRECGFFRNPHFFANARSTPRRFQNWNGCKTVHLCAVLLLVALAQGPTQFPESRQFTDGFTMYFGRAMFATKASALKMDRTTRFNPTDIKSIACRHCMSTARLI